jgi:hypothetical protein
MGLINFTNITITLFVVYFLFTIKSFYDIFNPTLCTKEISKKNPSDCMYSIKNWQKNFVVKRLVFSLIRIKYQ